MFRKSNKPVKMYRRLRFESLQNRVLLDATPIQFGLDYNSEIFSTNFYRQELDADFQNDILVSANVMVAGMPNGVNGTGATVGVTVDVSSGSGGPIVTIGVTGGGTTSGPGGSQISVSGSGSLTFGPGSSQGSFSSTLSLESGGNSLSSTFTSEADGSGFTIGSTLSLPSGGSLSGTFDLPSGTGSLSGTFGLPSGGSLSGTFGSGSSCLAGALHHMGISMGQPREDTPLHPVCKFTDQYLGHICRQAYIEPWLTEGASYIDRVNHLRHWAGRQCQKNRSLSRFFGGKHPIMSLLGPELIEAWNDPFFICIDRPAIDCFNTMIQIGWGWHPLAFKQAIDIQLGTRERFLEVYSPRFLRVSFMRMFQYPENVVHEICDFVGHSPTEQQYQQSLTFIKETVNVNSLFL